MSKIPGTVAQVQKEEEAKAKPPVKKESSITDVDKPKPSLGNMMAPSISKAPAQKLGLGKLMQKVIDTDTNEGNSSAGSNT